MTLHPLHAKLLRDLLQMRAQTLAITLIVASGIAMFVMSLATLHSLQVTQQRYYQQFRFAEVFAPLVRAPETLAHRIAQIPGVARMETRVVVDVILDIPELAEPASGRLISLPDRGQPLLNQLFLRRGRFPEPFAPRAEVLVSEAFANAHELDIGDSVTAIINARLQRLYIVGIALSPEYILQMAAGQWLPDPRRFGVFWMPRQQLEAAYDMQGAFNDVTLTLAPGASLPDVIRRLDHLIEPYGSTGAIGREDQISHRFVSDEIAQLRALGLIAPSIFLAVAAFLLNVMFSRLIAMQREQIAMLKAFGFTNLEIARHYLSLVLLIAMLGLLLGVGLGVWMGHQLARLYTVFYQFPVFHFQLTGWVVLLAVLVAVTAAVAGTMGAIARAVRLAPAEAMRPQPPATFRPTLVERLGLQRLFSESARMVLRQIERRPLRAVFSTLGIALAVAILVLSGFARDALDHVMDFQFDRSQRQDMTLTFIEPTSARVMYEVARLPGVMHSEPFRQVPVRLTYKHRVRQTSIMGLPAGAQLNRLVDANRGVLTVPKHGLLISSKLGELLGAGLGDWLTVHVREGRRPTWRLPVVEIIDDYSGTNAYIDIRVLHDLLAEGGAVSGAMLRVDKGQLQGRGPIGGPGHADGKEPGKLGGTGGMGGTGGAGGLYQQLKRTPQVAAVTVTDAMLQSFTETIAENQNRIRMFYVGFAVVIASGTVYNLVRVSLSERTRELATLRVLGFTRGQVSAVLLGELAVLTLLALPVGLLIGYGFCWLATLALDTEVYRIPLVVDRSTYGFAVAVVLAASVVSGLLVRRKLDRMNLMQAISARE